MEFLKRFALCISGLLLAIGLSAQEPSENITVKGEVLTVKSDAVIGAGVMLKGTTQGLNHRLLKRRYTILNLVYLLPNRGVIVGASYHCC